MAILRFEPNVALQIILRAAPQEVKSNYGSGTDFKYPLVGGDYCYVPPIVERIRQEQRIEANEPFTVCRTVQGKETRWSVERVQGQAPVKQTAPQNTQQNGPQSILSPQASTDEQPIRHTFMSQVMAGSYIAAVDAIEEATRYAASKGLVLKFSEESVQASANSIFIQYWRLAENPRYATAHAIQPVTGGAKWQH